LIVPRRILVINPNSSADVTAAIESGLDGLGLELRFEIACRRLESGPPAIESQADIESVVIPTVELIRAEPAAAYVIACCSDPGLALAREAIQAPVVGIAESAILLALGLGHRFGIIAIRDVSVRRHLRYVRSLGLEGRLAGDRPLNLGVHDAGAAEAIDRIIEVGRELRDRDGADVLILGCAGMGLRRQIIQEALGLPVIDPVQAAVARAASLIALRYPRAA
jgi:allantoin racemase